MCKLMKSNVMEPEKQVIGLCILWLQIRICKSDSSHVFHRSNSKFWTKDLVIFLPRVFDTSVGLIKFYSNFNDSKQFRSIDVFFLAVSEENSHWDLAILILVLDHIILTGTHVVNVCRNWRTLIEFVMPEFLSIFDQILKIKL